MYGTDTTEDAEQSVLAFANLFSWVRVIGFFRLHELTRYLIRMILQIIYKTLPFLSITLVFIIQCCVSLMAFRPRDDFITHLQASYRLAYGDFAEAEEISTHGERIYFVTVTIIIPLVLLNLLIAIMGDVFDAVQSTREYEDVRERLSLILEISKFVKCRRRKHDKHFIHVVTNDRLEQQEQDSTWEGKVKVLQKSFDAHGSEQAKRMEDQTKMIQLLLTQNEHMKYQNEEKAKEQKSEIDQQNTKVDKVLFQNEALKKQNADLNVRLDKLIELMNKSSS